MDYTKFTTDQLEELISMTSDILEIIKKQQGNWLDVEEASPIAWIEIRCFNEIAKREKEEKNR